MRPYSIGNKLSAMARTRDHMYSHQLYTPPPNRILSTGEDRLHKLYRAYVHTERVPESVNATVTGDHVRTLQSGGTLAVYSAKGTRFGVPGPSATLHGFHVRSGVASPIARLDIVGGQQVSVPRSIASSAL